MRDVMLTIGGKPAALTVEVKQYRAPGLDCLTGVESLGVFTHPRFPGRVFLIDEHDNVIITTPNSAFVTVQMVAERHQIFAHRKPRSRQSVFIERAALQMSG